MDSSTSRRHFHWTQKVGSEEEDDQCPLPTLKPSSEAVELEEVKKKNRVVVSPEPQPQSQPPHPAAQPQRRKMPAVAVARWRSVLTVFAKNRSSLSPGLGSRVIGTLFGSRRGHVHFAFQRDPNSEPAFLVELATPISGLVKEMASGLVRIALECDKEKEGGEKKAVRLLEQPLWRTFCNGKKSGFATRKDCGAKEMKILKAVEPISMGAGVLPGNYEGETESAGAESPESEACSDNEIMYMRAKFERIVGSRDSEAFYMMNPDSNGTPELSIYLLRV
ncbi:protein MIZU-KUSSEI 1-like [Benincasa hispida]|uniref:protein MIZU-KUSSEI 1-like n=1 Tax=Benincasa hispida TaxID=102211 RepID=UPI0019018651|nr:protein MIZU-KUSSEI 1-like [Benincasa hispida]